MVSLTSLALVTPRTPPPGLYDEAITTELQARLERIEERLRELAPIDVDDAPQAVGRLLNRRITHALQSFSGPDALEAQLDFANHLFEFIEQRAPQAGAEERLAMPGRKLLGIRTHISFSPFTDALAALLEQH